MGYYAAGDHSYFDPHGDPGFFDWLGNAAKQVLKVAAPVIGILGNIIPGGGIISGIVGAANNMLNHEAQPAPAQSSIGGGQYQSMQSVMPAYPQSAGIYESARPGDEADEYEYEDEYYEEGDE